MRPIGDGATLHEDQEVDFPGRGGRGWTGADCNDEAVTIGDEGWRVVDLWDGEAMTAAAMIECAIVVRSGQTGRVDDTDWREAGRWAVRSVEKRGRG